MEGYEKNVDTTDNERDEIFSKAVRAGKRTYFFDVKATKKNDYYLTITESKKRFNKDGRFYFEKHKLFLYKEDFDKFEDGLKEVVAFIKEANAGMFKENSYNNDPKEEISLETDTITEKFTNVEFEDLEK